MNLTVTFVDAPREAQEWTKKTTSLTGREFGIRLPVESLMIRLGPYDNSPYIKVRQLDDGEIVVLYDVCEGDPAECVLSVREEEV